MEKNNKVKAFSSKIKKSVAENPVLSKTIESVSDSTKKVVAKTKQVADKTKQVAKEGGEFAKSQVSGKKVPVELLLFLL